MNIIVPWFLCATSIRIDFIFRRGCELELDMADKSPATTSPPDTLPSSCSVSSMSFSCWS